MSTELLMPNAALTLAELIILGVVSWLAVRLSRLVLTALSRMEPVEGRHMIGDERREQVADQLGRYISILAGLGAIGVVGYNAWLTAMGHSGPELIMREVSGVSPRQVAICAAEIAAILVLLKLLSWLGGQFRDWAVERLKAAPTVRVEESRLETLGTNLQHLIEAALWYAGATLIAGALNLPGDAAYWIGFIFSLAVVWGLVRLISDALDVAIDAIYEGLRRDEGAALEDSSRRQVRRILDSIKSMLRWSVYVAAAAYVIRTAPLGAAAFEFSNNLIRAVGIIILAQLALAVAMGVMARLAVGDEEDSRTIRQRRETMLPLLGSLLRYVIYFVAGVMAVQQMGVDITAILAGAGIAGLAIGFGAQSLVQDVISGFFTLFEGEYMVGDFVEIGGIDGTVEALTLRQTSIRRRNGSLAILPNGQINEVINYSKRFVKAVVDVGVAYEGDLNRALGVLEEIARDARNDIPEITGPPTTRVLGFNASDVGVRLVVPVEPGKHWDVACELRRRVKVTFDEEGVEIPFARQVIILQTADGRPLDELPVRLIEGEMA
ncbi:MAG: mechanosensitive ion channel family protein [Armatimonadota bacterium]